MTNKALMLTTFEDMVRPSPLLGRQIQKNLHYTIVGAGISGLMMGFFLKEAGVSFEIIEQSTRVGGLLDTIEGQYGRVETGANGILWCKEIDYVAKKLNLTPVQPNQKDKKRYFVRHKKLSQFPLTIWETIGFAARLLSTHKGDYETVADFGLAYMGKAATKQILSPGLSGIYGTPADQLTFRGSAKMISGLLDQSRWLPLALLKNRKKSKKPHGLPKGLHSFEGGMKTLVLALTEYLKDEISINQKIETLDKQFNYILTTPAGISAGLMRDTTLFKKLLTVDYQPLISATLFFSKGQFEKFKSGFGCLIPRDEGLKSLGVLFTSVIYPERIKDQDMIALRCILHEDSDTDKLNNEQLQTFLEGELDQLFVLNGKAHDAIIHRWKHGLPIYNPQLYNLWPEIDQELRTNYPNIRLFGNYTGEISVRGACQTAFNMFEELTVAK